jgi:hypothetical protein
VAVAAVVVAAAVASAVVVAAVASAVVEELRGSKSASANLLIPVFD